jgi:outer membrane lipoprotein-sorting protein
MSRLFLIGVLAVLGASVATAQPTGKEIVKKMHDRYSGKWYRSFTFNQTTEVYRNDSLRTTQTWYEFIRFPERFRMDFGPADSGNVAIFRRDSCYRFRNGKLRSTTINNNEGLIFLLGGMFFYRLEKVYTIFDSLHYHLQKGYEDVWKGRPVYVIGANKGETGDNQLWVDKENLYPVRLLKADAETRLEALFEDWKPMNGGWLETKCSFYVNGKLAQVETYHDYKVNVALDDRIFDPGNLIRSH